LSANRKLARNGLRGDPEQASFSRTLLQSGLLDSLAILTQLLVYP
jgi:hypothetical protein